MIWILDNNPKVCAKYQCDEDLEEVLSEVLDAFRAAGGPSIWATWIRQRSQNWMWMYQFLVALEKELKERSDKWGKRYPATINWIWDHMPVLPCSPRGRKSKFPPNDKIKLRPGKPSTGETVHAYRKLFNETRSKAIWGKGAYQPPWYYGDV
jgi:hypothetical protein